jgi:hypothetical protein
MKEARKKDLPALKQSNFAAFFLQAHIPFNIIFTAGKIPGIEGIKTIAFQYYIYWSND